MKDVYVVLGFDNDLDKEIYGVFSTPELANECIGYLKEELEDMNHFEIEAVELDAFGYR